MEPQNNTPQPAQDQPQIDIAAIQKKATEDAQAAADAKIQQMKDDLAASISGKPQRQAPKSWEELQENIETSATDKAIKAAEDRITKTFEERQKAETEKAQLTVKQTEAKQKEEWAQMSREWSEAVADGLIPDIKPEVKKKLQSNVAFSDLTPEEQNDPGLRAYNDGRLLHAKLKTEGKSTSFYRTLQKFYGKMPAGSTAPVLGGSTPTPQTQEFTYDDVQANRKAKFGW